MKPLLFIVCALAFGVRTSAQSNEKQIPPNWNVQAPAVKPAPTPAQKPEQVAPVGQAVATQMKPGARVFIAPMEGNLNSFLAAEIVKKKVPVTIVTDEAQAEFILTGFSGKTGDNKWYHVVFNTGRDSDEGSVQVVSVASKTIIWAGEAGDRSLWWGTWARGGQRKVADRIISQLKKDLFK